MGINGRAATGCLSYRGIRACILRFHAELGSSELGSRRRYWSRSRELDRVRSAEEPTNAPTVVPLWPNGTPGAKGTDPAKDVPTLTICLPTPETATGAAVVVCPGGGYGMLAVDHEGKQVAEWLNSLGVAAFILKYRLGPRHHHPVMLDDAGRAIRTVVAGREDGASILTRLRSSVSRPVATSPRPPAPIS